MIIPIPIIPILAKAVGRFIGSRINPHEQSVSVGEAVVGEVMTRLVPTNPTNTTSDGWYDGLVSKAGREFGNTLLRVIKPGKREKVFERALGRFLKAAGAVLDPFA